MLGVIAELLYTLTYFFITFKEIIMYLQVIQWPESQAIMDDPDWFFIQDSNHEHLGDTEILGSSAYAKIVNTIPDLTELNQVRKERDDEAQAVAMLQEALIQISDTEQLFNTDNAVKIANETLEAFAERKMK